MQSIIASGAPYTLTATPALAALGTTPPTLTLAAHKGTQHLLQGRAVIRMGQCSLSTQRTVTLKLRVTSGTPADLAASVTSIQLGTIATSGQAEDDIPVDLPPAIYTKVGQGVPDTIQLFASLDSLTGVTGVVQIKEASIVATP